MMRRLVVIKDEVSRSLERDVMEQNAAHAGADYRIQDAVKARLCMHVLLLLLSVYEQAEAELCCELGADSFDTLVQKGT